MIKQNKYFPFLSYKAPYYIFSYFAISCLLGLCFNVQKNTTNYQPVKRKSLIFCKLVYGCTMTISFLCVLFCTFSYLEENNFLCYVNGIRKTWDFAHKSLIISSPNFHRSSNQKSSQHIILRLNELFLSSHSVFCNKSSLQIEKQLIFVLYILIFFFSSACQSNYRYKG